MVLVNGQADTTGLILLIQLLRGRSLIFWGEGVVRIFVNEIFLGDPTNVILIFFGKIDRRNFFSNMVLHGNVKKIFLGLN